MKLVYLLALLATAWANPSQPPLPTKMKNCIDHCKCKFTSLKSRIQIEDCDGPLILNETTFRYINKPSINVLSIANVIINQIQEDAFKGFDNLDDILILNSHIASIDAKTFNSIKRVKFADCRFEDRPDLFSEKMEELHFGNCQLQDIPKLNNLYKLTFLNLSSNLIKDVEIETFAELLNLEVLILSNNEIFKLPSLVFINNENLASLYLDNNPLKHFYLNTSSNIEILSIRNCHLKTFDEQSTQRLSSVVELYLSHNYIESLSARTLAHMKMLSNIDLSHNQLTILDDDVFAYNPHLTKIYLDNNKFDTLPNFYLKGEDNFLVHTFSCNNCSLKKLSSYVFENMRSMVDLKLSQNRFMNVDNAFQKIYSLKRLDISENNIAHFQIDTFSNNKNLETLNMASNPIMTLMPEVFAQNPVLREIDARNTSLTKLWSNTNNSLKNLHVLLLSNNQLTTLTSDDLKIMPKLELLDITNNPLFFDVQLCNLIDWMDRNEVAAIKAPTKVFSGFDRNDEEGFTSMQWKDIHNGQCPDPLDDLDEYNDNEYLDDIDDEVERSSLAVASYILSLTSAFVLSALVVLVVAVTLTLCLLKRNNAFNMHSANLPRFKISPWYTQPSIKKHSGSVYQILSEDISGPKTPKMSRYEFAPTPTVHSS